MHLCCSFGNIECLKELLAANPIMEKNEDWLTPLQEAALEGQEPIVTCILEHSSYVTTEERINALELLGAGHVYQQCMTEAVSVWKQAMQERLATGCHKPAGREPCAAYKWAVEAQTVEEIESLVGNPDIHMQALLIIERILGPTQRDTLRCIWDRGAYFIFNICDEEVGIEL